MVKKESVDERIEEIAEICLKQVRELLESSEMPNVALMKTVGDALNEMGEGLEDCRKAYRKLEAVTKREPGEPVREIAMGGGDIGGAPDDLEL